MAPEESSSFRARRRSTWEKSAWIDRLHNPDLPPTTFEISNVPSNAQRSIQKALDIASAQGYWMYHGNRIPIPKGCTFTLSPHTLNFTQFKDLDVQAEVLLAAVPEGAAIVNTHIFDALLARKDISQLLYRELPGVLRSTPASSEGNPSKTVSLYITTPLSESQWYCLFDEAKCHGIRLNLSLAPNVRLPTGLTLPPLEEKKSALETTVSSEQSSMLRPKVIVTHHAATYYEQKLKTIPVEGQEPTLVFDIEDLSYQDLFFRIDYDSLPAFSNFEMVESDLLRALREGQSVILKGQFSQTMLDYLHPILAHGVIDVGGEQVQIKDRLTLIIESPDLTDKADPLSRMHLDWLPRERCFVDNLPISGKIASSQPVWNESCAPVLEEKDSEKRSQNFLNDRKNTLKTYLQDNFGVILSGETGVGKTQLMQKMHTEAGYQVFSGLDALDAWANDPSTETKILFIDESNIENKHLTFLSPLQYASPKKILYHGKIYTLDDTHKVVFAHNPPHYGGGRLEQKLFEDVKIPIMQLDDFPPAYIYHEILKPIFTQSGIRISEEKFEKDCKPVSVRPTPY